MAGITLEYAQKQLDSWLQADEKVSRSQSYSHNGRQLSRVDAGEITNKIEYWNRKVQQLIGGRRRGVRQVSIR
jgi:hypothetical protein